MCWYDTEKEIDNLIEKLTGNLAGVKECDERDLEIRDFVWMNPGYGGFGEREFWRITNELSGKDLQDGIRDKYETAKKLAEEFEEKRKSLCKRIIDYQEKLCIRYLGCWNRFGYISDKLRNGEYVDDSEFDEAMEYLDKLNEIGKYINCCIDRLAEDTANAISCGRGMIRSKVEFDAKSIGLYYRDIGYGYEVMAVDDRVFDDVIVPLKYKSKPVISIGENAFSRCKHLRSVTLPYSVSHIGAHAFRKCKSLEHIYSPRKNCTIDKGAFRGCRFYTWEYRPELYLPDLRRDDI